MNKEKLLVAAIENGTVIDHIPTNKLFKVAAILGLEEMSSPITLGNNFPSIKQGKKGVIKISDRFFSEEELSRIAILAPNVRLNVIKNYEVVEKRAIAVPEEIIGLVKCPNPKCITNNEPMKTHFYVVDDKEEVIRCKYCGRKISPTQIELL
ncbi:aspartate carbamoyltransferase regulatory subunit [Falsiporphyromonas endometrii]|uniref:Aspartate carbamoyltransferase regulatory chain n=1 Tax=Falsiporphyromonas endometrii TaxID=1387297 RepID=A0ABV9K8L0_9PORP